MCLTTSSTNAAGAWTSRYDEDQSLIERVIEHPFASGKDDSIVWEVNVSTLRIYIGWDSREEIAYDVAKASLLANATCPVEVIPLKQKELRAQGLYTRATDPLASTEFTYTRFLVPYLNGYAGWALFCDCDFLFFGDVADLLAFNDPEMALYSVKHDYKPTERIKMDGVAQSVYPRKNWSSFMWLNCAHPSTRRLTPDAVNQELSSFLHQMKWAEDGEIVDLPVSWNWLEGWYDPPEDSKPDAVHYTRGGPWFENYQDVEYADDWQAYARKTVSP